MFTIILIAISLSIDAFGIGITYGIRKVIVPIMPKIIVSAISAFITFLSLSMGLQIQKFLPNLAAKIIGTLILFCMGIYLVFQSFLPAKEKEIQITRINLTEAFFIGCALSVDSIGSGIGLAMLGFDNFYLSAAVAVCQFIFLSFGIFLGNKISDINLDHRKFILLSGLILIFIACVR